MLFKNLVERVTIKAAFSSKNMPVCETGIVRGGRGMPWDKRIAIHPLGDGTAALTPLETTPPEAS